MHFEVTLHSRPSSIPGYLGGRRLLHEELVPALYPPVETDAEMEIDEHGRLHFASSAQAITYAEDLHAVVSEHGIDGAVAIAAVLNGDDAASVITRREERFLRTRPVAAGEREV